MRASIVGCCLWLACSGGHRTPEPSPTPPRQVAVDESAREEPTTAETVVEEPTPEPPNDPLPVATPHLALGGTFGCLADASSEVRCFGANQFGQRGVPASLRADPAPTLLGRARRVIAGTWHACLIDDEAMLRCVGHGGRGQLGDGHREDRASPVAVLDAVDGDADDAADADASLSNVVDACAGDGHTCARHADRRVSCWGSNDRGQLGDGTFEDRLVPTRVALDDVIELACGRAHTCARRSAGDVHCWGENVDGQLGDGTRSEPEGRRAIPARVEVVADRVFAGPGATCVIREQRATCWGRNDSFQLGVAPGGAQADALLTPTPLPDGERVAEIAIGARHTCVRDVEGSVRCVGANRLGQLGDGARHPRRVLGPVTLSGSARAIAAGVDHTCALLDGGAFCWGANREGQLGRRARGRERWSTTPVAVD